MEDTTNTTIELDGNTFMRVPVHARFRAAIGSEVPTGVVLAEKAEAAAKKPKYYWQDAENPDIVWVNFILDTEGDNKNWDYMPRTQLLASYQTAKYKPMDMEHIVEENASMVYMDKKNPPVKNTIFGVMTHAALADADGNLLSDKEIANIDKTDDPDREDDDKLSVVAWAALYYFIFPQTVANLVQTLETGNMKVSMERWIKQWDFLYRDGDNYQAVSRAVAEKNGLSNRWMTRQQVNGEPVLRRTLSYSYGGVASTTNPANGISRFIEKSKVPVKAAASLESDPVVKILRARHNEVVAAHAVEHSEAVKLGLAAEHEEIHRALGQYLGE